jgi:hypothetical protein
VVFFFLLIALFEGLDDPAQDFLVDLDKLQDLAKFFRDNLFPHIGFGAILFKPRAAVIDISLAAFLDVFFGGDGTAAMATGQESLKGELVLPLLGFVPVGQDLLNSLKKLSGYQRDVVAMIKLSTPSEIAVIKRVPQ